MKYSVVGYIHYDLGDCDIPLNEQTNVPKRAIEFWMQNVGIYPTDIAIFTTKKEDAQALLDYANDHLEWFEGLYHQYKNPYKLEYLKKGISKPTSFRENEYGYEDQVYPFCLG